MDDFVTPGATRLPLTDGKFVDIHTRLTHGDTEEMYERQLSGRRWVRTAKILAYVIGWSLTRKDAPIPMSPDLPDETRIDTIRGLDPDRAVEIFTAIEAHETAMEAARATEKKTGGTPASSATSGSPGTSGGRSATSAPLTPTSTA